MTLEERIAMFKDALSGLLGKEEKKENGISASDLESALAKVFQKYETMDGRGLRVWNESSNQKGGGGLV